MILHFRNKMWHETNPVIDVLLQVRDRIMAGEMLLTPEEIDELKQTFIGMNLL